MGNTLVANGWDSDPLGRACWLLYECEQRVEDSGEAVEFIGAVRRE